MAANDNQLRRMVQAMQVMANTVNSENPHITINHLINASRLLVTRALGFPTIFDTVDSEIFERVRQVAEDENEETVESIWARDVAQPPRVDCISRCILRLMRIIEVFTVLFEEILSNEGIDSLGEPINTAYQRVWAPFHGTLWTGFVESVAVHAPSVSHVRNILNEDENSMRDLFRKYVEASRVVINYTERLFRSNPVSSRFLRLI